MTDKSTQVTFTKCTSEAEVRKDGRQWLEEAKRNCKNKNQHNYPTVKDIKTILKSKHQKLESLHNLIEHIAKLTVLIKVPIKSNGTKENVVFGTGFIQRVTKGTKIRRLQKGGSECEILSKFGVMTISTVRHVLYPPELTTGQEIDLKEASIKIGYDDPKSDVKEAKTFTKLEIDKDINTYDWCSFECKTEDLNLIDRLSACITTLEDEQLKAYGEYNKLKQIDQESVEGEKVTNFIVVVGHPHGGPKKVSFGKQLKSKEILKQVRDQQEWCCYHHDANTCPGSSGSPVFIFGQPLCGYGYWFGHPHNHSGRMSDGSKVTSIGVNHIVTV